MKKLLLTIASFLYVSGAFAGGGHVATMESKSSPSDEMMVVVHPLLTRDVTCLARESDDDDDDDERKSYRPKGYRGFLDLNGGKGVGEYGKGLTGFTTSHGFQTCPYVFIGVGVGLEYHYEWETLFMPVFGNLHFNFTKTKCSPYLDMKAGYSPIDGTGLYSSASLGVNIQFSPKFGLNIGAVYSLQQAEFTDSYGDSSTEYIQNVGLKFGFEW